MYAILNISGKQFKASEGKKVRVPKQNGEQGSSLTFSEILLVNDGTNTQLGNPVLLGATVTATILDHGREKKILVYKKKTERLSKKKWTPSMVHRHRISKDYCNCFKSDKRDFEEERSHC